MKKLSIVVPVYFNELSLPELYVTLQDLEIKLLELSIELEVICVDDGSGDNSYEKLLEIKAKRPATKIIKHTRNFGAFHAYRTGRKFVTGDCFLFLAADLQDPPELIPMMAKKWLEGSKYIICVRADRHDPIFSRIFAKVYYILLGFIVAGDYPRGGYDLALMDKCLMPYLDKSAKNINPTLFQFWLGFKPEVIPYIRQERRHGKSRWTFSKKFKLMLDSLLGFSFFPIRFISGVGITVSLVSFLYGIWIIANALLGNFDVKGFAALATIISFLLGLIIIMLGIIGEYIWRIYDEVNGRPEAVIEETYLD